jgi:Zn-dependent M28 family amino/carboxypeptidase
VADPSPADALAPDPGAEAMPDLEADPVADPVDLPGDPPADVAVVTPADLAAKVDPAALALDLAFVAQPRPPGTTHWQAVQDLCADRFTQLGYAVERQAYGTGVNVIGVKPGASPQEVLVSAHYDSVAACAGADDNATGVAATLEAARALASGSYQKTLVVACWDEEEDGLIGSKAYAKRAKDRGEEIEVVFDFEMVGFTSDADGSQSVPTGFDLLFPDQTAWLADHGNRGDFLASIPDDLAHAPAVALAAFADDVGLPIVTLELSSDLKTSPMLHPLRRSDHDSFWQAGYGAIMLTDTSNYRNPQYHCGFGEDSIDTIDQDFMTAVVRATVGAAAATLGIL